MKAPKFKPGDVVYWRQRNTVYATSVKQVICFDGSPNVCQITAYSLNHTGELATKVFHEENLFATFEEAANSTPLPEK